MPLSRFELELSASPCTASRSPATCGSFAAREGSSCSRANCRRSASSPSARADSRGCSPAKRPCWPARRIPSTDHDVLHYVEPRHLMKLRMVSGLVGSIALVPEMLQQWIVGQRQSKTAGGGSVVRIAAKDAKKLPGEIRLDFRERRPYADRGRSSICRR